MGPDFAFVESGEDVLWLAALRPKAFGRRAAGSHPSADGAAPTDSMNPSPFPLGREGGPQPSLSSAGARRVRVRSLTSIVAPPGDHKGRPYDRRIQVTSPFVNHKSPITNRH